MGRTIPSFRIASVMEEKTWKEFREYLNKNDRKIFDNLFNVATLYNSASSYAAIPIRIHPIMMSIVFHHYKILKERLESKNMLLFTDDKDNDINVNQNSSSIILKRELEKWKTYSNILRQPNRDLFNEMIQSIYKYSSAIDAKGENYATESLLMSILLENYKKFKH
ncbi:MAG TPA: hypothetical protein VJ697_03585 [Nitrososphaeraceae archaeon]|nr:hypothetical protein [Nitrososphaeraceae archaeon]